MLYTPLFTVKKCFCCLRQPSRQVWAKKSLPPSQGRIKNIVTQYDTCHQVSVMLRLNTPSPCYKTVLSTVNRSRIISLFTEAWWHSASCLQIVSLRCCGGGVIHGLAEHTELWTASSSINCISQQRYEHRQTVFIFGRPGSCPYIVGWGSADEQHAKIKGGGFTSFWRSLCKCAADRGQNSK